MTATEKFVLAFNKADGTVVEYPIDTANGDGGMCESIAEAIAREFVPAPASKRVALNGANIVKDDNGDLFVEVEPTYPRVSDLCLFSGAYQSAIEAVLDMRGNEEPRICLEAFGFCVVRVKDERKKSVRLRIDGSLETEWEVVKGDADDDGNYELDCDYVADMLGSEYADSLSDYVCECVEEDVNDEYDSIEIGNYSYSPKDVLDAMGDWDSYVEDKAEDVHRRLADDICSELARPYDTCSPGPFYKVELVPVYVDEDGDFVEEIPMDSDESQGAD